MQLSSCGSSSIFIAGNWAECVDLEFLPKLRSLRALCCILNYFCRTRPVKLKFRLMGTVDKCTIFQEIFCLSPVPDIWFRAAYHSRIKAEPVVLIWGQFAYTIYPQDIHTHTCTVSTTIPVSSIFVLLVIAPTSWCGTRCLISRWD